jgi:hypothetical protein
MSETGIGTRGKWKLTLQVRTKEGREYADGNGPMKLDYAISNVFNNAGWMDG